MTTPENRDTLSLVCDGQRLATCRSSIVPPVHSIMLVNDVRYSVVRVTFSVNVSSITGNVSMTCRADLSVCLTQGDEA